MKIFFSIFFTAVLFLSVSTFGQYKVGQNTGGAFIGVGGGGLDGTGAIPISIEYNFLNVEQNIQIGAFASFSSTSEDFGYGSWSWTNYIIAAQGNYHIQVSDNKFDPFVGLSLGFRIVSDSWEWSGPDGGIEPVSASGGEVFFNAQAGVNYWFTPSIALQVRVGYYPYLAAGVTIPL